MRIYSHNFKFAQEILETYNKMHALLAKYYMEPENIPIDIRQDDEEDIFDF